MIEEQEEGEADYENGASLTRILSLVGICVQIFNVLVSSRLVERILSSLLFSEDGFWVQKSFGIIRLSALKLLSSYLPAYRSYT